MTGNGRFGDAKGPGRSGRADACLRAWAAAAVLATGLASGASAADLALIAGDAPAQDVGLLAEALNARGYEVYDRTGADRAAVAAALNEIAARLPEVERLILFVAGDVRSAGQHAWLMPPEFAGSGRIDAALAGLPLDLLLDLAAEAPGRSAVVVGAEAGAASGSGFLDLAPGAGAPLPPQGVLMIAGPTDAAVQAVVSSLIGDVPSVAAALETASEELTISGFRSPEAAFVAPASATAVTPPPARAPEAAEATETALQLSQDARARIQTQLTALGYNTGGADGVFGPGTRSAVTAWQRDQALEPTGFLTDAQIRVIEALADARAAD